MRSDPILRRVGYELQWCFTGAWKVGEVGYVQLFYYYMIAMPISIETAFGLEWDSGVCELVLLWALGLVAVIELMLCFGKSRSAVKGHSNSQFACLFSRQYFKDVDGANLKQLCLKIQEHKSSAW